MGIGVTKGASALKMKHASQGLAKLNFQDAPHFQNVSRDSIKEVSGPFHPSKIIVPLGDKLFTVVHAAWWGTLDLIEDLPRLF